MASDFPFFRVKASDISSRVKKSVAKLHSCKKNPFENGWRADWKWQSWVYTFNNDRYKNRTKIRAGSTTNPQEKLPSLGPWEPRGCAVGRFFHPQILAEIEEKPVLLNVLISITRSLRFTDLPKALLLGCKVIKIYFCWSKGAEEIGQKWMLQIRQVYLERQS